MHMGTANVSAGARAEEVSKAFQHMATLGAKLTPLLSWRNIAWGWQQDPAVPSGKELHWCK